MVEFSVTYSQNREDIYLSGFFKDIKQGFYVDVGANHPNVFSVTKKFYDEGWRGINIEPINRMYKLLERERPEDINLPIGVSTATGKLTLREYDNGDGLSTFSKRVQKSYEENKTNPTERYHEYEVDVMPLSEVLKEHSKKIINFMKVDVEGYEYEVLDSNDWDKYRPQVLCIESNHIMKDWRPLLAKHKYIYAFSDGLNDYYVASEKKKLLDDYSYPETMLAKPPLTSEFNSQVNLLKQQLSQAHQGVVRQELVNQALNVEISNLYAQIEGMKHIKSVVKQLARSLHRATLTHVEKLNKPRTKRQPPLVIKNPESASAILNEIGTYDFNSYRHVKSKEPLSYRVVKGSYLGTAKIANKSLRYAAKKTRRGNG